MLKADAYGHGLKEVARRLQEDVFAFGVATLEEGIALREIGVKIPILLLVCADDELEIAVENDLTLALSNCNQLSKIISLVRCGKIEGDKVKLHLALDTGMHRLGFEIDEIDCVLRRLVNCRLNLQGVYTHLREEAQLDKFKLACDKVRDVFPRAIRHIASSHTYQKQEFQLDMVRVGIDAYTGAMRVTSSVIATRHLEKGEGVSYGNFVTKKPTNVAVVFGGYADGIQRENTSSVYINNQKCKPVGDVCMDMTIVDTGDMLAKLGDEAVLFDSERAKEIAKERNTILYNVYTSFKGRVQREYLY